MDGALDPRQLECFIAAAEELNLNRAAARLHMSQPPLTRRIHRLEQTVGAELFRRTPKGLELTAAGATLLERAYRVVTLSSRAIEFARRANSGEIGHLAVGYYDAAILDPIPALLRQFLALHPDVTVGFELVVKRKQVDYLRDRLLHVGFGRHFTDEPGVMCRRVLTECLFVAVPTTTAAQWGRTAKVADLRQRPLVLFPPTRPDFADEVIDMCRRAGFTPRVAVEADDVIAGLAYVAIGVGVAVVHESATKTRPNGVTFIRLQDAPVSDYCCVYLADDMPPTLKLFADFLSSRELSSQGQLEPTPSAPTRTPGAVKATDRPRAVSGTG
ncbi:LysR family transcriptional regulator [Mycobacterium sp. BMJ-28]